MIANNDSVHIAAWSLPPVNPKYGAIFVLVLDVTDWGEKKQYLKLEEKTWKASPTQIHNSCGWHVVLPRAVISSLWGTRQRTEFAEGVDGGATFANVMSIAFRLPKSTASWLRVANRSCYTITWNVSTVFHHDRARSRCI